MKNLNDLPTPADLGVVVFDGSQDMERYWRASFYDESKAGAPIVYLFDEEPEHRAIEALMEYTGALTVGIEPPTDGDPKTVKEAARRVLAIARGMKSINDQQSAASLLRAALAYQLLYREDLRDGGPEEEA